MSKGDKKKMHKNSIWKKSCLDTLKNVYHLEISNFQNN